MNPALLLQYQCGFNTRILKPFWPSSDCAWKYTVLIRSHIPANVFDDITTVIRKKLFLHDTLYLITHHFIFFKRHKCICWIRNPDNSFSSWPDSECHMHRYHPAVCKHALYVILWSPFLFSRLKWRPNSANHHSRDELIHSYIHVEEIVFFYSQLPVE